MHNILRRFENFAGTLGVLPDKTAPWWWVLCNMYGETGRHYHTLHHVENCLDVLNTLSEEGQNRDLVELALWFHDIVYSVAPVYPGANEQQSAVLGVAALKSMGLEDRISPHDLEMAIMCTTHPIQGPIETNPDFKLVYDLDIWVLGGSWEEYKKYSTQIAEEYVPTYGLERYTIGRAQVLRNLLDEPCLYLTDIGQERREEAARRNLGRELSLLGEEVADNFRDIETFVD